MVCPVSGGRGQLRNNGKAGPPSRVTSSLHLSRPGRPGVMHAKDPARKVQKPVGEAGGSPRLECGPNPDQGGRIKCANLSSHSPSPVSRARDPCGEAEATGAPWLPRSPNAGSAGTPLPGGGPGASMPRSRTPTSSRAPGPGAGRGGPGRRSQRLPAGAAYMVARGRAGLVYAGERGPRASAQGHPAATGLAGPLSPSQGGRGREPTGGHLGLSPLRTDLAYIDVQSETALQE
uniref:Cuticle collagen 2C-like n=1 Tax=Castor canadensis TaxID=51338 RepID=A0A8B7VU23_CASCN|nr:cuticle collagen 2C-like [Castor canadensis]